MHEFQELSGDIMGVKILKLYVKGVDKVLSAYTKVSNYFKERKPIDMEMNCPAEYMFPQLFSEGKSILGRCPYGEMHGE
jgi:hypothetical protein